MDEMGRGSWLYLSDGRWSQREHFPICIAPDMKLRARKMISKIASLLPPGNREVCGLRLQETDTTGLQGCPEKRTLTHLLDFMS
jgi:hypothetical protein